MRLSTKMTIAAVGVAAIVGWMVAKEPAAAVPTTKKEARVVAFVSAAGGNATAPVVQRQGLSAADLSMQLRDVEAAVREGNTAKLDALVQTKLADDPELAPAVIRATANLAAQGGEKEHGQAVRALAGWLKTELHRDGSDAAGNVPNLIEALGDLGGREAVDALVGALGDTTAKSDLALDTLIVQRLGALGDARAKTAITRFAKQIPEPAADSTPFDRELHAEAVAAANEALAHLL
jgi:hypothetical protein